MDSKHEDPFLRSYNENGPKKVGGGPFKPGSRPDFPDRVVVRMADPRIEDFITPERIVGVDNTPAKDKLEMAENGTGRE